MRQALARSAKVAVAKYAWSGRERLGLLRVRDDVIVLHAMRWPDEIRDPAELLPPPVEISQDEIDSALALMDTMTRDDLEGEEFRDTYTDALAQVIEAKQGDKPLPEAPQPEEPGKVLDLMAALTESVSKGRQPAARRATPTSTTCRRSRRPRRRRRRRRPRPTRPQRRPRRRRQRRRRPRAADHAAPDAPDPASREECEVGSRPVSPEPGREPASCPARGWRLGGGNAGGL
ncbi:Ku protein [Streptomyces bobili]|uniref:Ku protein n=1 Tax=Streptomyces bobili TaxID=67280 RepID=UPI0033A92DBB